MIASALVDEALRYVYVLQTAGVPTLLGIGCVAAALVPGVLLRRVRRGLAA